MFLLLFSLLRIKLSLEFPTLRKVTWNYELIEPAPGARGKALRSLRNRWNCISNCLCCFNRYIIHLRAGVCCRGERETSNPPLEQFSILPVQGTGSLVLFCKSRLKPDPGDSHELLLNKASRLIFESRFPRLFCYSFKSLPIRDGKVVKLRFLGILECNPISLPNSLLNLALISFSRVFLLQVYFPS